MPEVTVLKTCDLWDAFRKLSNPEMERIIRLIYSEGPKNLGEIREAVGRPTNALNHDLLALRNADIVRKIEHMYHLTVYGAVLLEAIDLLRENLEGTGNELMEPMKEGRL